MNKNTIFSQLSSMISHSRFNSVTNRFGNERYVKKFSSWDHFKTLFIAQIKGFSSLRAIESGLKSRAPKLYRLGIRSFPNRSTLSDANNKRNPDAWKQIFLELLSKCKAVSPKHKFRFKKEFYSLDSTTISLCLKLCEWAKFRTTKAGIKVHTLLNNSGYIPEFIWITSAKMHDSQVTKWYRFHACKLSPGSVIAVDRGFLDFSWFFSLTKKNITFITRSKSNMNFKVIKRRKALKNKGIIKDNIIRLRGFYKSREYPEVLRLIKYKDKESGKIYEYLTNNFDFSARTIADCYKERWQVELFFKWIKQHLKIKRFFGNSQKAIHHQIWVALIYYLIISYVKFSNKWNYTLLEITRFIKEIIEESIPLADIFDKDRWKIKYPIINPLQFNLFKPVFTGH